MTRRVLVLGDDAALVIEALRRVPAGRSAVVLVDADRTEAVLVAERDYRVDHGRGTITLAAALAAAAHHVVVGYDHAPTKRARRSQAERRRDRGTRWGAGA